MKQLINVYFFDGVYISEFATEKNVSGMSFHSFVVGFENFAPPSFLLLSQRPTRIPQ